MVLTLVQHASADLIPYPTPGIENPVTYSFTAASTGDVIAYFAGSAAAFDNVLGMEVNGVLSPNGFGLDNHTSAIGQSFNLGSVNAGDSITFVMHNVQPGLGDLYSDPTRNGPYDNGASHNHIYSTVYTSLDPFHTFPGVPPGTYVAFEDLPGQDPTPFTRDWNYFDETFVFTNISTITGGANVPLPSTALCGVVLLAGLMGRRVFRRQYA